MANNTRAKKRKVNNRSPTAATAAAATAATSTPEIVRAGRGHAHQDNHHVSHLDTLDRDDDRDSDSDCDGGSGSDSDTGIHEGDDDKESSPVVSAFFTKNRFNTLEDLTTPPPTKAKEIVTPTTASGTTNTSATLPPRCFQCDIDMRMTGHRYSGYFKCKGECYECRECNSSWVHKCVQAAASD